MAFTRLNFEKTWTEPADFPTYEDSEDQVREDLQYHPDAIRDYLNGTLIRQLEGPEGAASIGVGGSGSGGASLQALLDGYEERFERVDTDIETIASGGVPSVAQCVQVPFTAQSWTRAGNIYTMAVHQDAHKRTNDHFGYNLFELVSGALLSGTWHAAATRVTGFKYPDGDIVLTTEEPYAGAITFFGV